MNHGSEDWVPVSGLMERTRELFEIICRRNIDSGAEVLSLLERDYHHRLTEASESMGGPDNSTSPLSSSPRISPGQMYSANGRRSRRGRIRTPETPSSPGFFSSPTALGSSPYEGGWLHDGVENRSQRTSPYPVRIHRNPSSPGFFRIPEASDNVSDYFSIFTTRSRDSPKSPVFMKTNQEDSENGGDQEDEAVADNLSIASNGQSWGVSNDTNLRELSTDLWAPTSNGSDVKNANGLGTSCGYVQSANDNNIKKELVELCPKTEIVEVDVKLEGNVKLEEEEAEIKSECESEKVKSEEEYDYQTYVQVEELEEGECSASDPEADNCDSDTPLVKDNIQGGLSQFSSIAQNPLEGASPVQSSEVQGVASGKLIFQSGPKPYVPDEYRIAPCIRLIVKETPSSHPIGSLFIVTCQGATIGREGEHDIVINDISISKNHLQFQYELIGGIDLYKICDLGSRNGTFINGVPIKEPSVVQHGAEIRIGNTVLLCHIHSKHDTCMACEPTYTLQTPDPAKLKSNKLEQHKREVKRIKSKFGLDEPLNYQKLPNYVDRSEERRKTVGSSHSSEKTQCSSTDEAILPRNRGFKLLQKMGWKEGERLGRKDNTNLGVLVPITVEPKVGRTGVGCDPAIGASDPPPGVSSEIERRKALIWGKTRERFKNSDGKSQKKFPSSQRK